MKCHPSCRPTPQQSGREDERQFRLYSASQNAKETLPSLLLTRARFISTAGRKRFFRDSEPLWKLLSNIFVIEAYLNVGKNVLRKRDIKLSRSILYNDS